MANVKSKSMNGNSKAKDAENLELRIIKGSESLQKHIYKFSEDKLFRQLGFSSLKEWVENRRDQIGFSYDTLNNYLHTARITVKLFSKNEIGMFSPYSFKPLYQLSDKGLKLFRNELKKKYKTLEPSELKRKLSFKTVKEIVNDAGFKDENLTKKQVKAQEQVSRQTNKAHSKEAKAKKRKDDIIKLLQHENSSSLTKQLSNVLTKKLHKKQLIRLCKKLDNYINASNLDDEFSQIAKQLSGRN